MSGATARTRSRSRTSTKKSRDEEDSDSDFEFDLSGSVKDDPQEGPNKFMLLCDSVHSSLALMNTALEEFYLLKNELMKHELPLKVLTTISVISTRIQRYHSDLYVPVTSLTRMVRVYSRPWDEKSATLKKIKKDQESKQRQLDIALKKIEMFSLEEERIRTERRIMNWERLYAKLFNSKSQGYRWKFLIESFKAKLNKGLAAFNPYMSDSDEDSDDDDIEAAQLQVVTESSEDELKDLPSDSEGEIATSSLHGRRTSSSLRNKSSARSSRSKRVRFADESLPNLDESSTHLPKSPYPAVMSPVESHDATTWTHEPTYNCHLVLCVYRPNSLEPEKELYCTLSLGSNFFSSKKFPKLRKKSSLFESYQEFWFHLSKNEAQQFPAVSSVVSAGSTCGSEAEPDPVSKLAIAVYANNISTNIIAMASVPLKRLTISTEPYRVKPPVDRSMKFTLDKSKILSQLMVDDGTITPTPYRLTGTDEEDAGAIPMCCHLVMVEELMQSECSTDTIPLEGLLEEMGYRKVNQTFSRATSPMKPFEEEPESIEKEDTADLSQEQYAVLSLQHAEELREIQEQYENKIETLTKTLSQMKKERMQQDSRLTAQEQELQDLQKAAKPTTKSPEHRTVVTRKKLVQTPKGLPAWGSSFPEDFYERMELFAQESIQKHDTLVKKIRKEVSNTCEKQMASQHKLAQSVRTNYSNIMEDVSLPAILMPTKLGHVYSPRAHCYFHPTGTSEPRVTQAPAVFKLPILKNKDKLTTLNLFDINELFCSSSTDPTWMKTADQSPMFTPAPPPSACGFNMNPSTSPPLVKRVK